MSTSDLPLIYGLTGGIASGKSTVSNMFRELGALVIDADVIAREIVTPPSEALDEIQTTFGAEFIAADGTLDRERLGVLVFEDPEAREKLNSITHPQIGQAMLRKASEAAMDGHDWVIYDAALLVENGLHRAFPGLIVVAASRETQIDRMAERDGLSRDAAEARIESQMPLESKVEVADWVIDNDGALDETRAQVEDIYHQIERQVADGKA